MPVTKKQQTTHFSKDAFKPKKVRKLPTQPTPQPDTKAAEPVSALSMILESQDPSAFVIQPPDKKSKLYLESKIYFWETSDCIKIKISSNDITYDVVRHLMTLYKQS